MRIIGEVKDSEGNRLSEVTVVSRIEGVWSCITDMEGKYLIKTTKGDVLSFRCWGYKLHEVEVDSDDDMEVDVVLEKV